MGRTIPKIGPSSEVPTSESCGHAAAALLRRQRHLPLPGPGLRGAALRPRGAARCGLAADRLGGARVLRLAPPLARLPGAAAGARLGRRAGVNELLLLPGDRPPPAGH